MVPNYTPYTGSALGAFGKPIGAFGRSIKVEPSDTYQFNNTAHILTPHTGSALGTPEKRSETFGNSLKPKIEIEKSRATLNEQKNSCFRIDGVRKVHEGTKSQ